MTVCPTCGQPIRARLLTSQEQILSILRDNRNGRARDIYQGQDGNWYITHGGGQVDAATLDRMVKSGSLVRTYDECADSFTIGKTMAVSATTEARKRGEIVKGQVIYTDGTRGQ